MTKTYTYSSGAHSLSKEVNEIKQLSKEFDIINFSSNQLFYVAHEKWFRELISTIPETINFIHLDNNSLGHIVTKKFKKLMEAFSDSVTCLNLSSNDLYSLNQNGFESVFCNMNSHIEFLNLEHNQLSHCGLTLGHCLSCLSNASALKIINISNNGYDKLDDDKLAEALQNACSNLENLILGNRDIDVHAFLKKYNNVKTKVINKIDTEIERLSQSEHSLSTQWALSDSAIPKINLLQGLKIQIQDCKNQKQVKQTLLEFYEENKETIHLPRNKLARFFASSNATLPQMFEQLFEALDISPEDQHSTQQTNQ